MIYPPNADINEQIARSLVLELYTLPKIESWHVYNFAQKFGVIVTSKMDIRKIAIDRGMNIRDILGNYKQRVKHLAVAICLLLSFNISAQVQPKTDSMRFVQGVINSYNVLSNDIGPSLRVTSFKVKTTSYDTTKTANIVGIGSISINGRGVLSFKPFNDTFSGYLPEISYIANNTLSRGVSAKVVVNIFKKSAVLDPYPAFRIYKSNNEVLVDYGGIIILGFLNAYNDGCKTFYCVIADNVIYPLSKPQYDLLK